jgi:uncharacterized Ntn-hydrolase superfamily protein
VGPTLDLRVDDHADPLAELERLEAVSRERWVVFLEIAAEQAQPGRASSTGAQLDARIAAALAETK